MECFISSLEQTPLKAKKVSMKGISVKSLTGTQFSFLQACKVEKFEIPQVFTNACPPQIESLDMAVGHSVDGITTEICIS